MIVTSRADGYRFSLQQCDPSTLCMVRRTSMISLDARRALVIGTVAHIVVSTLVGAQQPQTPYQRLGRDILRELVETNTEHSIGSTTKAAELLAARFRAAGFPTSDVEVDRKSTRLNSSHSQISYAVFCLKKKNSGIRAGIPPTTGTGCPAARTRDLPTSTRPREHSPSPFYRRPHARLPVDAAADSYHACA